MILAALLRPSSFYFLCAPAVVVTVQMQHNGCKLTAAATAATATATATANCDDCYTHYTHTFITSFMYSRARTFGHLIQDPALSPRLAHHMRRSPRLHPPV
jgi:hypothetical protein